MSPKDRKLMQKINVCVEQKHLYKAKELLTDMEPVDIAEGLEGVASGKVSTVLQASAERFGC